MNTTRATLLLQEASAFRLAYQCHAGQDYGDYPYIVHLQQVVAVAKEFGFGEDGAIIAACVLHDVLEDSTIHYNDLVQDFGDEVAEIVYCVTDELGRNRHERHEKTYPKTAANENAVIVKLCDRLANVRFSVALQSKQRDLYANEHADFVQAIYNPLHERAKPLWGALNAEMSELEK